VCDLDGSPLVQRADDKPETIRARLSLQLASLGEVADYYSDAGLLRVVDGVQPIEAVTDDLLAAITDPAPNGAAGAV
jgi:adenylate kinase